MCILPWCGIKMQPFRCSGHLRPQLLHVRTDVLICPVERSSTIFSYSPNRPLHLENSGASLRRADEDLPLRMSVGMVTLLRARSTQSRPICHLGRVPPDCRAAPRGALAWTDRVCAAVAEFRSSVVG